MVGRTDGILQVINRIRDPLVAAALRVLQDEVQELRLRVESGRASINYGALDYAAIRAQLQRGGAAPLSVEGLRGVLADAQVSLAFEACRVFRDSNQSVNDDTLTAISFTRAQVDTAGMWAVGTPTRVTFRVGGTYLVGGAAHFAADADGFRLLQVRANGATVIADDHRDAVTVASHRTRVTVSTIYNFDPGEFVELLVHHTAGAALAVPSTADVTPVLWAHRLGLLR